ncbi:MAG TPA: hypothetical protein VFC13_11895, partial [Actinomycetes bacterium]|nr:hypothetical protein [Actinomycetes bacterium]
LVDPDGVARSLLAIADQPVTQWSFASRGMGAAAESGPSPWAALGPRTTGKSWTTAANDGQLTALVSSRFRAFAQVMQ